MELGWGSHRGDELWLLVRIECWGDVHSKQWEGQSSHTFAMEGRKQVFKGWVLNWGFILGDT